MVQLINICWTFWLYLKEVKAYYGNATLRRLDISLMLHYGRRNPFALSASATRQGLDPDLTVYGETPWTTLQRILDAVAFTSEQHFVELGAGTGRNLCFVHCFYGSRVTGYELIPDFVTLFSRWQQQPFVQQLLPAEAVSLVHRNWFEVALEGDVFLLVGTCYNARNRRQAERVLRQLAPGKKVITISYRLPASDFLLLASFAASFSWGKGTVFIQERVSASPGATH